MGAQEVGRWSGSVGRKLVFALVVMAPALFLACKIGPNFKMPFAPAGER